MSFDNTIAALARRVEAHSETIQTEEAVKTSVILPFLQALGYDVFDPAEVVPEYTADAVGKKGEKVDYAIQRDGAVSILIECKGLSTQLNEKHLSQLFRYFTVTPARFAILTNGREYRFLSDLEEPNKLDRVPFFTFDLLDHSNAALTELRKFSRDQFDVGNILAQAERLKYVAAIRKVIESWIDRPSDAFVRAICAEVQDGRVTAELRATVAAGIGAAFREIVRDRLRLRLSTALDDPNEPPEVAEEPAGPVLETTEEEIEGWLTVKSLLRGTVPGDRIHLRDAKSYCAILLDDNNRKPLARLHFNRKQKYVGLFDGEAEDRIAIASLDEMLDMKDRLVVTAEKHL